MSQTLFQSVTSAAHIAQHKVFMNRPLDEASELEHLAEARTEAIKAGTVTRPVIDRSSAKFGQTEKGAEVAVSCTLTFEGPASGFSVRPHGLEVRAYGEAGGFEKRDKLVLRKTFAAPVDAEAVKATFRSILDDIDAALDAIQFEVKQHNDSIADQVDRLVEKRRKELGGFEALREGLSDGL